MASFTQAITAVNSGLTATPTLSGVAAGSSLILAIGQSSQSVARTYTGSSSVDGSFGTAALYAASAQNLVVAFFVKHAVTAGTHIVAATANNTATFEAALIEWPGLDSSGTPVTDTFDDGAVMSTHYSADDTSIDVNPACAIVALGVLASTSGVTSKAAGVSPAYTAIAATTLANFFQAREATNGAIDDRGTWTHIGTARRAFSGIVAFPMTGGAPPTGGGVGAKVRGGWFGR